MTARIGIVGIGWWATFMHIPAIQAGKDATVVAICDLDPDRVQVAGDKFGIPGRYTDVDAMLAAERLDGVIVGTPHVHHAGPAIAALIPDVQFVRRERFSTLSWAGSKKLSRMPARSAVVGFSGLSRIRSQKVTGYPSTITG